jgi:hypothetical protein
MRIRPDILHNLLLKRDLAYFSEHVLEMEISGHHKMWSELVAKHNKLSILSSRDHGKSFFFSFAYIIWRSFYAWIPPLPSAEFKSIPRQPLGYIFSNTQENAIAFLSMVKDELESNALLRHLVPARKEQWSKTEIKLANSSIVRARGYGVAVRGGHPGFVVLDDVLTDENIYSEIQREKVKEYFYSAITPMVIPGGQTIVIGTPMHSFDLYGDLQNNPEYGHSHFPAIKENGDALWPSRYTLEMLKAKEREIGSVRFAREYMCVPISDMSTLFPDRIIQECCRHDLSLITDVPQDLWDTYDIMVGVDLALSSSVGADYTVIMVVGVDEYRNRRILDIRRSKGKSMTDQLNDIYNVNYLFRPTKIFIESYQFQKVFADEIVSNSDLPVQAFTTTSKKNSLEFGLPSLQILFENGKFQIPRKTERDRRITDILINELRCFTWTNGKLAGVGSHDDTVMALYITNEAVKDNGFSFSF